MNIDGLCHVILNGGEAGVRIVRPHGSRDAVNVGPITAGNSNCS
jgi:hypothetical protein